MIHDLMPIINKVSGASFFSIDTETVVPLLGGKKNEMKGRVTKRTIGSNVMLFQNKSVNGYDNMVRRRLADEGKDPDTFQLSPRAWGERVPNLPLVKHTKNEVLNYYLEVIFLKPGKSSYFLDGKPIDKDKIEGFPPERDDPDSQAGLENKVIIRTYAVNSLIGVRGNGASYEGHFEVRALV